MRSGNLLGALLAGVGLLACAAPAQAAVPVPAVRPLYFEHLTMRDGLSQSTVEGILQDSQGYLWLATESGLDRYDGNSLRVYHRDRGNPARSRERLHLDHRRGRAQRTCGWQPTAGASRAGSAAPISSSSSGTTPRAPTPSRAIRYARSSSTPPDASGSARSTAASTCSIPRPAVHGTSATRTASRTPSPRTRCSRCTAIAPGASGSAPTGA